MLDNNPEEASKILINVLGIGLTSKCKSNSISNNIYKKLKNYSENVIYPMQGLYFDALNAEAILNNALSITGEDAFKLGYDDGSSIFVSKSNKMGVVFRAGTSIYICNNEKI